MSSACRTGFQRRQLALFLVSGYHLARLDFGAFDVGLVEGVDPQAVASHSGSQLPQEELPAQVVEILDLQPHDRLPGQLERLDLGVKSVVIARRR